jgi:predicted transcriptional regulator
LRRYLADHHEIEVRVAPDTTTLRRYDPAKKRITFSEVLPPRSRHFQLAHQIALIDHDELLSRLLAADPDLQGDSARTLARLALANYFAGAVLMPYEPFARAARAVRYDIEALGHRFRTSFEQICHRLTTLRRPGLEGIPFHFARVDLAGNLSKRFAGSGIRFARFSGACPLWNVFRAFLTPGRLCIQLSRMPGGETYFDIARTVTAGTGGFHSPPTLYSIGLGCEVRYADELIYADGVDLTNREAAVPIGATCRLCTRTDCAQRAFPSVQQPLVLDLNTRARSFYAPSSSSE